MVSRLFNLGAGSTWPGHIALEQDEMILPWMVSQLHGGVILIAGTNGKTTTAKMVRTILEQKNNRTEKLKNRVVHNEAGANLLNGLTSALIMATDWRGKIKADWGIFEVDEATLPLALKYFTPKAIVLLNLFRDQLDRYGEVDSIAQKWHKALKSLPKESLVILNADDPQVSSLGQDLKARVFYFGLDDPKITLKEKQHAMDTVYCPTCGKKLIFSRIYFSHLGDWRCPGCKITRPKPDLTEWDWPLQGIYNRYNTLAAVMVGKAFKIDDILIKKTLVDFEPVFGRLEEFNIDGKKIKILLSKNPTGFNESLRTIREEKGRKVILLVLNDRIPDGRDVSWIWDADFDEFENIGQIFISGDRPYDMGLRMKYAIKNFNFDSKIKIKENLNEAITEGIKAVRVGETLYVLPTYSAMLEVRKIITGRKIL